MEIGDELIRVIIPLDHGHWVPILWMPAQKGMTFLTLHLSFRLIQISTTCGPERHPHQSQALKPMEADHE